MSSKWRYTITDPALAPLLYDGGGGGRLAVRVTPSSRLGTLTPVIFPKSLTWW